MKKHSSKKVLYITLFTLLGLLLQFLLHAVIEIVYIQLLLVRYDVFGLGLEFSTWFVIHNVFATVLVGAGLWFGFSQGVNWWKRIYEKREIMS